MNPTNKLSSVTALLLLPCLAHCYHGAEGRGDDAIGTTTTTITAAPDDDGGAGETGQSSSDDGGGDVAGETSAPADDGAVDEYIRGLGHLGLPQEEPPMKIECEGEECQVDDPQDGYQCTYTYYSTTEHFDEFVAFQPNSATLWPGSIVEGRDASVGLLTSVTLPRAPLTYSASLENLIGSPVGIMEKPSLSQFRATMQAILAAGVNGSTPANVAFKLQQVFSEAEVSLALSTAVSWPGGNKISGMFDFKAKDSKTRILADFTQAYYTVDVDVPAAPSDLFAPDVTVEALAAFMSPDNPPMYVQSITYGRRGVFSIETAHSEKEVRTALEAAISAIGTDVEVATEHRKVLDSSTMTVFVMGGDGDHGSQAVLGFDGFIDYILAGGNYSSESPGATIAYKLAYLDNFGTKFAYTTDFAEANCTPEGVDARKIRVYLKDVYFDGNGEGVGKGEVTYRVWASASGSDECVFVDQPSPQKIGDNQSVGVGVACDFTVVEEPGASVSLSLQADEDGKFAQGAYSWTYDPQTGWPAFGDGVVNAENGNLDVDANLTISFLE